MDQHTTSKFSQRGDNFEETVIAVILGLMTAITFANVVARFVFNSNILWALEVTVFLFAWLVLIGISYCVKKNLNLGVDVVLNLLSPQARRVAGLFTVGGCLLFSLLILKGSWDYWYPFASSRAFYETEDVPMPDFLQFLAVWLNEGERYEKLPRFIPYFALPLGMALLTFRFAQAGWRLYRGDIDMVIASHEAEDALAAATKTPID